MYKNPTKNCGYLPIKIKKPETLTLFFDVTKIKHNDSCFLFIKREPKVINKNMIAIIFKIVIISYFPL